MRKVATHPWRLTAMRGVDIWAPQQKSGEPKEQGDGEVESTENRTKDWQPYRTRLKRDVGRQHAKRGDGTHPFQLG